MSPALFGKNLKRVMRVLGINQADLAEKTGLTPAAVCQIIQGKRDPSLESICKILGVIPVKFELLVKDER